LKRTEQQIVEPGTRQALKCSASALFFFPPIKPNRIISRQGAITMAERIKGTVKWFSAQKG
jgi:hypothetical protein